MLASDDEEDEDEIESEDEEDRAFLDNDIQEQEDVSFYRRFHVELDRGLRQEQRQQQQELTMYDDMLFGQEQTSDNKLLNELAEKLTEYLRELPVLGFNSGKYDLNAVEKNFLPIPDKTSPHQVHCQKKQQPYVSQDRFSQAPGHFELSCAGIQL